MTTRTGALLIHGLGGTEYDLGGLKKTLGSAGIDAHAILLPGHGETPERLATIRAEDWLGAALARYEELAAQYDEFHIIGMCMGALVSIALCDAVVHTKGRLVLLSPPVHIDGWKIPWYGAIRHLFYRIPGLARRMKVHEAEPFGIKNPLMRGIVRARMERGHNLHYRWVPLASVRQVDRLRRRVKRCADRIACPTVIAHARADELTSLRSATFLESRIADARTVVLENSYHMICIDNDSHLVEQTVLKFLGLPAQAPSRFSRRLLERARAA